MFIGLGLALTIARRAAGGGGEALDEFAVVFEGTQVSFEGDPVFFNPDALSFMGSLLELDGQYLVLSS